MSAPALFTEDDIEQLGDFIAERRDEHPRHVSDMDSWELAEAVLDWVSARLAGLAEGAADEQALRRDVFAALEERSS